MLPHKTRINEQYGNTSLFKRIKETLEKSGINPANASDSDFSSFDQLHLGGKPATLDLALSTKITPDMHLLDVGCGLGGPARTLAGKYGCRVTGIDLTKEFCKTASLITRLVKMDKKVFFVQGNALSIPSKEDSFHMVWTQHFSMNVKDKASLYKELHRVLKQNGSLVLHEVISGSAGPVHFPVPWARSPEISHLSKDTELKDLISKTGFTLNFWEDISRDALNWYRETAKAPRPSISARIVFSDLVQMASNMKKNLSQDRVRIIRASFTKEA